jgi:outer membrane receptor protein involved in Fe transport
MLLLAAAWICAQTPAHLTLTLTDSAGNAVANARVSDTSDHPLGQTNPSGIVEFTCQLPCRIHVDAPNFASQDATLTSSATLRLTPARAVEQVTVTAYRAPLGDLESPAITRRLDQSALESTAAVTLDNQIRQIPGAELFRRSSSLVANPASQGISLRGLGSTSASRTLVTEDDVPLNDPIGGWIHWEEQPELALQSVELVRGGASDLYGSSAIGGVLNLRLAQPSSTSAELRSTYGGEGAYQQSLLGEAKRGPYAGLAAATLLATDGYTQEAPSQRGPVDAASSVHAQNGLVLGQRDLDPLRIFARLSGFHEARANGTPYQKNSTRLIRYATGLDWHALHDASLAMRLYGSRERYWQTFSSITNSPTTANPACSYRCSETPTRFADIPDNELGASAHWSQPLSPKLLVLAGAGVQDVRVWDDEQTFGASAALTRLHDHQRDSSAWAEALWSPAAWTLALSARYDWWQNYDGRQLNSSPTGFEPAPSQPPQFDQRVFDPRLGISRKLTAHWAVNSSAFRAFRAPTPSELYRSTQVGNQLTKPNGSLQAERATGWETGLALARNWCQLRAAWFSTQINRPISAVTVNPNSSPILLMRENLGQITSRGLSIDYELHPWKGAAIDGGYQYAHSSVTRGTPASNQDLGNWIPEVARNMATLNLRQEHPRWGQLALQSRLSGRQFDDDANTYLLHSYFRLDAYASHNIGRHLQLFAAGENLFNRQIEVAKTPTTTLAMPRTARAGIEIHLPPTHQQQPNSNHKSK